MGTGGDTVLCHTCTLSLPVFASLPSVLFYVSAAVSASVLLLGVLVSMLLCRCICVCVCLIAGCAYICLYLCLCGCLCLVPCVWRYLCLYIYVLLVIDDKQAGFNLHITRLSHRPSELLPYAHSVLNFASRGFLVRFFLECGVSRRQTSKHASKTSRTDWNRRRRMLTCWLR